MISLKQDSAASPAQAADLRKRLIWGLGSLLILILSAAVYMSALHGLPIWEDERLIHSGEGTLQDCFLRPFLGAYFRPLVSLSFWLDHKIWGEEPFMFHQTNILLHVLTTLVLMATLKTAFQSRRVALVGSLLFAIQPAQVSAVAWIGGRTDSLCTLWVALFAGALIRSARSVGRPRALYLIAALLWYLLALLTKEQAIALLPLVPLTFRCFLPREGSSPPGAWKLATLPFVLLSAAFLGAAYWIGPGLPRAAAHGPVYALSLCGRTITYYALLLFAPTPRWMHTVTTVSLQSLGIVTVISGYALLVVSLALIYRWMRSAPAAAWFLALSVLALLPVSNVLPVGSLIVAPFRAGIAGVGVAALLGWLITAPFSPPLPERRRRSAQIAQAAGGTLLALWCLAITAWGAGRWDDNITLYTAFAKYDPGSLYIREGQCSTLMEAKKPQQAAQSVETLLAWFFGP